MCEVASEPEVLLISAPREQPHQELIPVWLLAQGKNNDLLLDLLKPRELVELVVHQLEEHSDFIFGVIRLRILNLVEE